MTKRIEEAAERICLDGIYQQRSVQTHLCYSEGDCDDSTEQWLEIETINNGQAIFIRVKTERWAVSDKEEWIALWDKFIQPCVDFADADEKAEETADS